MMQPVGSQQTHSSSGGPSANTSPAQNSNTLGNPTINNKRRRMSSTVKEEDVVGALGGPMSMSTPQSSSAPTPGGPGQGGPGSQGMGTPVMNGVGLVGGNKKPPTPRMGTKRHKGNPQ